MRAVTLATISSLALAACGGRSGSDGASPEAAVKFRATPPLSLAAQVGRKIFFDKALSASGKMSCATCHDPNHAYGPPNDLAVQPGGRDLTTPGLRAVPSLRYKEYTPAYADLLDNPDGISVPGPGGGFTWDGRADTLAQQAGVPLLSAFEMANAGAADVVAKLRASAYSKLFRQAFGDDVFNDTTAAFNEASAALQAYQLEDSSFHPYSSKFDLYAGNKIGGAMTPAEARGLAVFSNPKIGNCSSCHYQGAGRNGSSALFTDFSYEAIGVPRNARIRANLDAAYVDMGVCGPLRTDHNPASPAAPEVHCGMFGTPTLRNVATRKVFFHNGVIHSLEQAIRFYNTRDTNPEIWYPNVGGMPRGSPDPSFPQYGLVTTQYDGGTVQKFDDLPAGYHSNIDTQMPLDARAAGSSPPMTEQNIADLICFLSTLTDGYKPSAPSPISGPCVN
ncbi:MAG TPA: cytochrome c peroxidase [Steroidobacteraceae bacterium]|jgi:cytochrome c peroxidase|nr:cytochrome c peroxidase [Steroidobacteraceae bacterium]